MFYKYLPSPQTFLWWAQTLYFYPFVLGWLVLLGLLPWVFNLAPDVQHGHLVSILFIHVPASWWALFVFTSMAFTSLTGLAFRSKPLLWVGQALAPLGFVMTGLSLITGMLWGKPAWGAFWVWDARLTSMFFLFILYGSYLNIIRSGTDAASIKGAYAAIIGWVNIPIIKWSVTWWSSLHQPPSLRVLYGYQGLDSAYLWPLLWSALGFGLLLIGLALANFVRIAKCARNEPSPQGLGV